MRVIDELPSTDEAQVYLQSHSATQPVPLKTILVAISDSKHSEYALNWSISHIFKNTNCSQKIILFSVLAQPSSFGPTGSAFFQSDVIDVAQIEQAAQKIYVDASNLLRLNRLRILEMCKDTIVEMVLAEGESPRDEIVEYTDNNNVDLVVIGSRGLSAMKRYGEYNEGFC